MVVDQPGDANAPDLAVPRGSDASSAPRTPGDDVSAAPAGQDGGAQSDVGAEADGQAALEREGGPADPEATSQDAGKGGPIDVAEAVAGDEADVDDEAKVSVEVDAKEAEADAANEEPEEAAPVKDWYILKVQVNREDTIRQALQRRIKREGLDDLFGDIIVPTEEVREFGKSGKSKVVKRKLYPGYLVVQMAITDETWFLLRETSGIGDFTGAGGKPTPMEPRDVERLLRLGMTGEEGGPQAKTAIAFKIGDQVRVKEGNFQNFEGQVSAIDAANGRITVMISIFNRLTPVEFEHWNVEST